MPVGIHIVNHTKKEIISFCNLPVQSRNEIVGNPISSSLSMLYMINNREDSINIYDDNQLYTNSCMDYKDVTNQVLDELVDQGFYEEVEQHVIDQDDNIHYRRFVNLYIEDRR